MARNIELKAKVRDLNAARDRIEKVAGNAVEILDQVDTYFAVQPGRLKLRQVDTGTSQLICYRRSDDSSDARPSDYHLVSVPEGDELKKVLTAALGIRGTVKKRRELYKIGATRIHLDAVEYLGAFIELEVPVTESTDDEKAKAQARDILEKLDIAEKDLLRFSYIDLLLIMSGTRFSGAGARMIPYYDELIRLHLPKGQYALFGSALLSLYRIRPAKDLDVIVKKDLWYILARKYSNCIRQQPERIQIGNLELFMDWMNLTDSIDEMIDTADMIEGVPFVRFEYVVVWKRWMGRQKDLKDIRLIEEFMKRY